MSDCTIKENNFKATLNVATNQNTVKFMYQQLKYRKPSKSLNIG